MSIRLLQQKVSRRVTPWINERLRADLFVTFLKEKTVPAEAPVTEQELRKAAKAGKEKVEKVGEGSDTKEQK